MRRIDGGASAVVLALALVGVAGNALGGVHVDRDRSVAVDGYATYAIFETEPDLSSSDPIAHAEILGTLRGRLERMGLREVESDPDCWLAYRTIDERHGVASVTSLASLDAAATDAGLRFRSFGSQILTVTEYAVGTLILDVFDGPQRRLVWRGSLSGVIPPAETLGGRRLEKMARRVFRRWEAEYRRQSR